MLVKDSKKLGKKDLFFYDGKVLTKKYSSFTFSIYLCLAIFILGIGLIGIGVDTLGSEIAKIGTFGLLFYIPIRAIYAWFNLKNIRSEFGDMLVLEGKRYRLITPSMVDNISNDVDSFIEKTSKIQRDSGDLKKKETEITLKESELKRKYQKLKEKGKQEVQFNVLLSSGFSPEPQTATLIWHSIDSDWDAESSINLKKKITSFEDVYLRLPEKDIVISDFNDWNYDNSDKVIERKSSSRTNYISAHTNVDIFGGITLGGITPITTVKHEKGRNILNIFLGMDEQHWLNLSTEISYGRFGDRFVQHELNVLLAFLQKYFGEKKYKKNLLSHVDSKSTKEDKLKAIDLAISQIREKVMGDPTGNNSYKDILAYTNSLKDEIKETL